jgi:hypothetical protein
MKKLLLVLLLVAIPFFRVNAIENPLHTPNNSYGIHIVDPNDLEDAAKLVNSNGGKWGYVTLVIQENDRNHAKWQGIFNTMRRLQLIPIVRIATYVEGDVWKKPNYDETAQWVTFLNGLNWPIHNRYVTIFNEPNHAKEWGGELDPAGYGAYLVKMASELKGASEDFFILNAGFDVSASNDGEAMNAESYIRTMIEHNPELLTRIDGWATHSYPNPAFSGSPYDRGRGTIDSFDWEIHLLQSLGLQKELPIFITETGWAHNKEGAVYKSNLTPSTVAKYLTIAYETIWKSPSVVAVTPFLLNYQGPPFDVFSWRKLGSSDYYPMYAELQSHIKIAGKPTQRLAYELQEQLLPNTLVSDSTYVLSANLTNAGQGIIDPSKGDHLLIESEGNTFSWFSSTLPYLEPGETKPIGIHMKTPPSEGKYTITLTLMQEDQRVPLEGNVVTVIPPPSLTAAITIAYKKNVNLDNVKILVYDKEESVVQKFENLTITDDHLVIPHLTNIVPNKKYRIVILIPGFLPRQTLVTLASTSTEIAFDRFLPFDPDGDGTLTVFDVLKFIQHSPYDFIHLMF